MQPRQRARGAMLAKLVFVADRASALKLEPVGFRGDFDGVAFGAAHDGLNDILEDFDRNYMDAIEIIEAGLVVEVSGQTANGRFGEEFGEQDGFGGLVHR